MGADVIPRRLVAFLDQMLIGAVCGGLPVALLLVAFTMRPGG